MKKVFEHLNKVYNELSKIKKECLDYLNKVVGEQENKEIAFPNNADDYVYITYDGGAHPEYASCAFAVVQRLYFNEAGKLCVKTDCGDMHLEYCTALEVADIAEFVYHLI